MQRPVNRRKRDPLSMLPLQSRQILLSRLPEARLEGRPQKAVRGVCQGDQR